MEREWILGEKYNILFCLSAISIDLNFLPEFMNITDRLSTYRSIPATSIPHSIFISFLDRQRITFLPTQFFSVQDEYGFF